MKTDAGNTWCLWSASPLLLSASYTPLHTRTNPRHDNFFTYTHPIVRQIGQLPKRDVLERLLWRLKRQPIALLTLLQMWHSFLKAFYGPWTRPSPHSLRTMSSHCCTIIRALRPGRGRRLYNSGLWVLQLEMTNIHHFKELSTYCNLSISWMVLMYVIHTLIDHSILVCHFGHVCVRSNTEVTGGLEKQEMKRLIKRRRHSRHFYCTLTTKDSNNFKNTTLDAGNWLQL